MEQRPVLTFSTGRFHDVLASSQMIVEHGGDEIRLEGLQRQLKTFFDRHNTPSESLSLTELPHLLFSRVFLGHYIPLEFQIDYGS